MISYLHHFSRLRILNQRRIHFLQRRPPMGPHPLLVRVRAHFRQQVAERHIEIQRVRTWIRRRCGLERFRRRSLSTFNLLQVLMGPVHDPELVDRLVQDIKVCP